MQRGAAHESAEESGRSTRAASAVKRPSRSTDSGGRCRKPLVSERAGFPPHRAAQHPGTEERATTDVNHFGPPRLASNGGALRPVPMLSSSERLA
jgi:hypothetical protein